FFEKYLSHVRRGHFLDPDIAYPAAAIGFFWRVHSYSRQVPELIRPVFLQKSQAIFFLLSTDSIVKVNGIQDGQINRNGMSSDLIEIEDGFQLQIAGSEQGLNFADFFLFHIQHSTAQRNAQPLVQAAAIVVAVQLMEIERKLPDRVCTIEHYFDSSGV